MILIWRNAVPVESKFSADWFGEVPAVSASYSLSLDGELLVFRFRAEKTPHCFGHSCGEFVEGLWERDVAEFFVAGPGPSYQEVNVAPCGAWWSALFSGYRERQAEVRLQAEVQAWPEQNSWAIEFRAALAEFPLLGSNLEGSRWAVCSILHRPEPLYLCSGHHQGGEPDFHQTSNLEAAQIRV